MSNTCMDCSKEIDPRAKRCRSCAAKARWENGVYDDRDHSRALRAAWENGAYDDRDNSGAMKAAWKRGGALRNPERNRKISAALKAAHARGAWTPEVRHRQSESVKALHASGRYDGIPRFPVSPTSIELATAAALDICGIEHKSQYRPDGYSRIYDEFVSPNILIEVHGDYWHGPERPEHQKADAEKAAWAKKNGYHLIIIWEHEIKTQGAWSLVHERILPLLEGAQCVK